MEQHVFACLGHRIVLATPGGDDLISTAIRNARNFYEADVLAKCREIYLPGTAVVDVGANIGNHTVFFGRVLGAPVYAFEPFPLSFEFLRQNVQANGLSETVSAFAGALGAVEGRGDVIEPDVANFGMVRVKSAEAGRIEVRRLDSFEIGLPVGLLKIDVEGSECAVLMGATNLIRRDLPDIMLEAGDPREFADAARFLLDLGYVAAGRYAATPTYLFRAARQEPRMARLLARLPGMPASA